MRGLFLTAAALLGFTGASLAQDPNWVPWHNELRPDGPRAFGYTDPNGYEFHRAHLYRHYYTPPSRNPYDPPAFGYTPRDAYRFRPTRQFNFYHYDENGNPR